MKHGQTNPVVGSMSGKPSPRRSSRAFCPVCSKQVELITPKHAAKIFHTDLQDIQFLTKGGELHRIHNRKGSVMVCSLSLFECFENRRTRLLASGIMKKNAGKAN